MPSDFRVPIGADVWATLRLPPEARADRARGDLMVVGRLRGDTTVEAAERRVEAILAQQKRAFPDTHAKREVSVRSFTDGFRDSGVGSVSRRLADRRAAAPSGGLRQRREPGARAQHGTRTRVRGAPGAWCEQPPHRVAADARGLGVVGRRGAPRAAAGLGEPAGTARDDARHHRALRRRMAVHAHGRSHVRRDRGARRRRHGAVRDGARVARRPAERDDGPASGRAAHQLRPSTRPRGAGCRADRAHADAAGRARARRWRRSIASRKARSDSIPRASSSGDSRSTAIATRIPNRDGSSPIACSPAFAPFPPSPPPASPASSRTEARTRRPASGRNRFQPRPVDAVDVNWRRVTPDALPLMRVPLLAGRMIQESDRSDAPPVALVSQSLASRFWPGKSAIGQRFRLRADGPLITVVGVVGDVTHHWLIGVKRATRLSAVRAGSRVVLRHHAAHGHRSDSTRRRAARGRAGRGRGPTAPRSSHVATSGRRQHRRASHRLARPWRDGAGVVPAVDDWALRPDFVSHRPAHARDRLAHGAGRVAMGRDQADRRHGRGAGGRRRDSGPGAGVRGRPICSSSSCSASSPTTCRSHRRSRRCWGSSACWQDTCRRAARRTSIRRLRCGRNSCTAGLTPRLHRSLSPSSASPTGTRRCSSSSPSCRAAAPSPRRATAASAPSAARRRD